MTFFRTDKNAKYISVYEQKNPPRFNKHVTIWCRRLTYPSYSKLLSLWVGMTERKKKSIWYTIPGSAEAENPGPFQMSQCSWNEARNQAKTFPPKLLAHNIQRHCCLSLDGTDPPNTAAAADTDHNRVSAPPAAKDTVTKCSGFCAGVAIQRWVTWRQK